MEARLLEYEGIVLLLRGIRAWESEATGKPKQAYQACLNGTDSDDGITIRMLHVAFTRVKVVAPESRPVSPFALTRE